MPSVPTQPLPPELLSRYARAFSHLHRNKHPRLGDAPHKPVLLLAILNGIERGWITDNRIGLTPELVATFRSLWRALVPEGTWSDKIVYPFRHLVHEKFWTLEKNGRTVPTSELGHPSSIGQFSTVADTGRFADDLWRLLQDRTARAVLRSTLLDTYFAGRVVERVSDVVVADPLTAEADRLIEEAQEIRFRKQPTPQLVRESDAAYLRHYLFPRVVTRLYAHACAVCRLDARHDMGGAVVDAAHVMPFARFHNDDPRNGLALCKNHHWGFDRGWFTVSNTYRLLLSSRVSLGDNVYLTNGAPIALPSDVRFAPAPEALAWHQQNIFRP